MVAKLAEWYRLLSIPNLSEDLLEKRSGVIKKLVKAKDINWMLECIRLFLNKPLHDEGFKAELTNAFVEVDQLFKQKDNLLELRVLSGAIINEVIEGSKSKDKISVALAAVSGVFQVKTENLLNMEVIENANKFLHEESSRHRALDEKRGNISLSFDTTVPEASPATLTGKFNLVNEQFQKLSQTLNDKFEFNNKRILMLEEESNMHWWIFRGCSNLRKKKFDELSNNFASVIIGRELAELTTVLPFPPPYNQLLVKVLSDAFKKETEFSFKESINSADEEFQSEETVKAAVYAGNLCPLLTACSLRFKSGDPNGWSSMFEKASDVNVENKIKMLDLARQSYYEHLLIKSLS